MPELPAFAPEHARDRAAAEAFAASSLPTAEEDVWRYSPVAELELDRFSPAAPAPAGTAVPERAQRVVELAAGLASTVIVTVNGSVVAGEKPADVAPSLPEAVDAFDSLHAAFADPIVVRVAPGRTVDPVVVVHWVEGRGVAVFPHVVVDAGADSEVRVLEVLLSGPEADVLVLPVTDLVVGKAARVGHVVVQDLAPDAWSLGHLRSSVDQDATLTATAVGMGGSYARLRTDCRLTGRGATGNLRAMWFGEGDQRLDFRTFQDHAAPDTTSDLVYKGAAGGRSRSVYTGLIRVGHGARGTNAVQTNRNLKLSDDAWAESIPNLEIHNNDVRCAHASAVGPVDEEQRWYLESRGVPTAVAERLIVAGFFDEALADLPVREAIVPIKDLVARKLEAEGLA